MGCRFANGEPNPMARAWRSAAQDLGIELVTPFRFQGNDGRSHLCTGLVPHFGSPRGALLVSRHDDEPEVLREVARGLGFLESALEPHSHERYTRKRFLETLRRWGWYGPESSRPDWLDHA